MELLEAYHKFRDSVKPLTIADDDSPTGETPVRLDYVALWIEANLDAVDKYIDNLREYRRGWLK